MKRKSVIAFSILFFFLFCTFEIVAGQNLPTDGLVFNFPFNGNANDESGNGIDGTVYHAVLTEDRYDEPNSAYSFDGSNDFIELPLSSSLDITGEISISFWII